MPVYFMPQNVNNNNYHITRKLKNGVLIRDQLPSEGIYTPYEMSRIFEDIPGQWIKTSANNKAYIWGLRKLLDVTKIKIIDKPKLESK
jgi:hypothetical protein